MSVASPHSNIPADGLKGLRDHWRSDLISAFAVALVALPLGLGIAMASNVPPMAGVISAVIGGLFATFVRGSHVAINGPAAGLIVVILTAMETLGGFEHVLGATVVAGAIQILMGAAKLGKLGKVFPSSVIHGMLAAIGVIIFGKQAHVALGQTTDANSSLDVILAIPKSFAHMELEVFLVSVVCLGVLVFHKKIKNKLVHFLPAPVWVMLISVPLVAVLLERGSFDPVHMLTIEGSLQDSLLHPSFDKIGTLAFWMAVMSITLVASIETLLSTAAIDKLDPYKRQTNLNRDLIGVGVATAAAGLVGGLPIITVIVRSSVNINHGGQTRWANFFHGLIILVFLLFFMDVLGAIPLAALAAILVYTGFKLASPKVFKDAYRKGPEQFVILSGTLFLTLKYGLLEGIVLGVLLTLVVHLMMSRMPPRLFLQAILQPEKPTLLRRDNRKTIQLTGLLNFVNLLRLQKSLDALDKDLDLEVDLSRTHLVDHTVMEYLDDYTTAYRSTGRNCHIMGLDVHQSPSEHPHALRVHIPPHQLYRLTRRQKDLKALAAEHNWVFEPHLHWGALQNLGRFAFFETRPVEHHNNVIRGVYPNNDISWTTCDVTFDEGALLGAEVYQATLQVIELGQELPLFVLEREELLDKLFVISGYDEFDYNVFTDFSSKFVLKSPDEAAVRAFFTPERVAFFDNHEIYHVESCGDALLVKYYRLSTPQSLQEMLRFTEEMIGTLLKGTPGQAS
jgi:MFS superfamily sulfate permease-like transporter